MNLSASQLTQPLTGAAPLILRNPRVGRQSPLIGQILMDMGALSSADLLKAAAIRAREDILFGEILLANRMVGERTLFRGLARQFDCGTADLTGTPPDIRLIELFTPARCLRSGIVPWKRIGAVTLVATSRPEEFNRTRVDFPKEFGQTLMVIAPEREIQHALLKSSQKNLAARAETRVARDSSCRGWNKRAMARFTVALLAGLLTGLMIAPKTTLLLLTSWAIVALMLNTGLKAAAAWATFRHVRGSDTGFVSRRNTKPMMRLPKISVLVPLYREREIAGRLVRRLSRLNYPRELLEICLIVEQDDTVTQSALEAADLPVWMRQIVVPHAELRTKPRALNFALDFCKGTIIGVYDAEDAPEPDQLYKIARRFYERGPQVACLQGLLDFYNARTNWLSRCFTIEYATWFRVVLPGLERLGFAIPLGGTTVFFRREALEKVGGWDAHNVTEDADLGIRLARYGYRTELIATLTEEEANCRLWPWVRQRSRWLKGYAITWAVHMRDPRRLWRELGPWKFFGVQLLFLGTLSQFLLAPLLWSFWVLPLGLTHPLQGVLSPTVFYLLTGLFFTSEFITLAVGIFALTPVRHRRLWLWTPVLIFYFPLASIAAYKGIWELITKPFYWDKTAHGQNRGTRKTRGRRRYFWRGFSRPHARHQA